MAYPTAEGVYSGMKYNQLEALAFVGLSARQPRGEAGCYDPKEMPITRITPQHNGPLRIEGEFRTVISLCRCGHSENKPFCDGSHNRVGFSSPVVARELPPPKPKL